MNTQLKGNGKWGPVPLITAFSFFALLSTQAMSATSPDTTCDLGTIRGIYGIQMQGTRPVSPGVSEQVVGVVLRTYDGRGYFEQIDNIKGSMTGISPDREGSGTYEVNADCTGTTSFQPDPNSPAPLMISNVGKRVDTRGP